MKFLFFVLILFAFVMCKKEEVFEKLPINVTVDHQNISAFGESDAFIKLLVEGGIQPYSFVWSNGDTVQNLINIGVGQYSVIVFDSELDSTSVDVEITGPVELIVTYEIKHPSKFDVANGRLNVDVSGGVSPYVITFDNEVGESPVKNIIAGDHILKVTDDYGQVKEFKLKFANPIQVTHTKTDVSSWKGADGSIDVTLEGGLEPLEIKWSTGSAQEDLVNLNAGYYEMNIEDARGSKKKHFVEISEPYDPSAELFDFVEGISKGDNATIRVENNGLVIYFDPISSITEHDADYIFLTHDHGDHFAELIVKQISKDNTKIFASTSCSERLSQITDAANFNLMLPGDSIVDSGIEIITIPSYNNDFDFHRQDLNYLGFIVTINGLKLYHGGDTGRVPEMKDVNSDISFMPLGPSRTMSSLDEAIEAIKDTKPKVVIPMHYGFVEGTTGDAYTVKNTLSAQMDVVIKPTIR